MNDAACDSFQFVWNCIFLFLQITYNACDTYDVPTESKLPVPVDVFFIHLLVMMTVVQISLVSIFWDLIFDLLNFRFAQMRPHDDARCMCYQYDLFSNINEEIYYIRIVIRR